MGESTSSKKLTQTVRAKVSERVIYRAANYMIRRYGKDAVSRANARYHLLMAEGYDQAAELWMEVTKAICAVDADQDESP
jgi:hypothetical protein